MFPWRKLWFYIIIQKNKSFLLQIPVDDNADVQLDVAIGLSYSRWNMEWSDEQTHGKYPVWDILRFPAVKEPGEWWVLRALGYPMQVICPTYLSDENPVWIEIQFKLLYNWDVVIVNYSNYLTLINDLLFHDNFNWLTF